MRIKVSTLNPLPKLDFWHVIHDIPSNFTVLDLQRDINQQVDLSKKSHKLCLFIDGFRLLPNSNISDLVRDGDTITIKKIDRIDPTTSNIKNININSIKKSNKRKRDQSNKEEDKKKHKTPSSSSVTDTKSSLLSEKVEGEHPVKEGSAKTKNRNKRRKLLNQYNKLAEKQLIDKKDNNDNTTLHHVNNNNDKNGKTKEKMDSKNKNKSNKKKDDQHLKNDNKITTKKEQNKTSIEINKDNIEYTTTTTTATTSDAVKSKQLLKKNKNKKKDFLKDVSEKPKTHIHFGDDNDNVEDISNTTEQQGNDIYDYHDEQYDQQYMDDYYNSEQHDHDQYYYNEGNNGYNNTDLFLNTCGAAFVTDIDTGSKRRNNGNNIYNNNKKDYQERQYPVDEAGPIIFAVNEEDDNNDDKKNTTKSTVTEKVLKKVDYDKCMKLTFEGEKKPVVGDHLAIKTLDLSETYTPEISNWKEVIVVELNKNDIIIELINQKVQQSNKGKRKFDLPEDEEGEEEIENNQDQQENIRQYLYTDIFDMCKITA